VSLDLGVEQLFGLAARGLVWLASRVVQLVQLLLLLLLLLLLAHRRNARAKGLRLDDASDAAWRRLLAANGRSITTQDVHELVQDLASVFSGGQHSVFSV